MLTPSRTRVTSWLVAAAAFASPWLMQPMRGQDQAPAQPGRPGVQVGVPDGRGRGGPARGAGARETALFVTPGFRFRVVDLLLTNFHLPKSTLLMLVSAFAGIDRIRAAYAHAIEQRYRFFSYGDAMLLERAP